jgi:hypothetical protein
MPDYHESTLEFGREMYSFPYGEHIFVMVRPLVKDWSHYSMSLATEGNEEWRPVMVAGHGSGQHIRSIGSSYAFPMSDFEFGPEIKIAEIMAEAEVTDPAGNFSR